MAGEQPVGARAVVLIYVWNQLTFQERQEGAGSAVARGEAIVRLGGGGRRQVVRSLAGITAGVPTTNIFGMRSLSDRDRPGLSLGVCVRWRDLRRPKYSR